MNNKRKNKILRGIILISLSAIFNAISYILFGNGEAIISSIIYMLGSIPIDILVTGIIVNNIVNSKDQDKIRKEVNMLLGIFFHEFGEQLLEIFVKSDEGISVLENKCIIKRECTTEKYKEFKEIFERYNYKSNIDNINVEELKNLLDKNSDLIVDLISNPMLGENECFTNTVIAVMHLRDELNDRYKSYNENKYEKNHINEDINYAYKLVALKWVEYMKYLKEYYPKLFEKALINSPFDNRSREEKESELLNN